MTDPLGNVTSYSYTPTTFESAMNFNGAASTTDQLLTTDGLGRLIESQTRTAPGATTFDNTIVYGYGWNSTGTFTTQTIPGGTAVTKTQNDALGRPLTITDGGRALSRTPMRKTMSYLYSVRRLQGKTTNRARVSTTDWAGSQSPAPSATHPPQLAVRAQARPTELLHQRSTLRELVTRQSPRRAARKLEVRLSMD